MTGPAPDLRPASEVYWVRLVTLPRGPLEAFFDTTSGCLDRIIPSGLNLSSTGGFDPATSREPGSRYRIVVGLRDRDASIGVAMPRRKKLAERAMAEIEGVLAASTAGDFERRYDLAGLT